MKPRILNIICAALIFCTVGPVESTHAAPITIGIEARVSLINDDDTLLEGKVNVNDIITGSYTYDTDTPDTNPASDVGDYLHYSPPCGVLLMVGGFTFMSDPSNTIFGVEVVNNYQGLMQDYYSFGSTYNLLIGSEVELNHISWQLDDYSGTALSSTALPTTAPVLSDWDYNKLNIDGGIGGIPPCFEKTFYIEAYVISTTLIPEPASLFLIGFGLLMIKPRRK